MRLSLANHTPLIVFTNVHFIAPTKSGWIKFRNIQ